MQSPNRWFWVVPVLLAGSLMIGQTDAPKAAPEATDAPAATEADKKPTSVYLVPIKGPIDGVKANFVERSVKEATEAGAEILVLDIDTPGGEVGAALDICRQVKNFNGRTVAWVHPEAISAGAMISVACQEILIAKRGKIGDCAPIMVGPDGLQTLGETEREKMNSYILAEFRSSAKDHGYPLALCEAMVALGPAIYQIKNTENDELAYVQADRLSEYGLEEPSPKKKKDADKDKGEDEGDAVAGAESKPGKWVHQKRVLAEKKLLTLIHDEAIEFGFAKKSVSTEEELAEHLGVSTASFVKFETNWSEQLVELLTSPMLRGLLTIVMLMGLYSEMQSPGLGFPGAVALVAASILFGAPYLTGLASMVEVLIFVVGVILILVEFFVIPGFGVAGITGIVLILGSLVMTFVPDEPGPGFVPTLDYNLDRLREGMMVVGLAFAVSIGGMVLLARYFGVIPGFNRLIMATPEPENSSIVTTAAASGAVAVGAEGKAISELRPAGQVQVGDRILDVVTEGQFIDTGKPVRVVAVQGNRITVEEA